MTYSFLSGSFITFLTSIFGDLFSFGSNLEEFYFLFFNYASLSVRITLAGVYRLISEVFLTSDTFSTDSILDSENTLGWSS